MKSFLRFVIFFCSFVTAGFAQAVTAPDSRHVNVYRILFEQIANNHDDPQTLAEKRAAFAIHLDLSDADSAAFVSSVEGYEAKLGDIRTEANEILTPVGHDLSPDERNQIAALIVKRDQLLTESIESLSLKLSAHGASGVSTYVDSVIKQEDALRVPVSQ